MYGFEKCPKCGVYLTSPGHMCPPDHAPEIDKEALSFRQEIEHRLDTVREEWGNTKLSAFYRWLERH